MKAGRKTSLILGLILLLGVGIWFMIPDEEAIVRRTLTRLAATVSFPLNESPLLRLANASRLRDFLEAGVEVQFEYERVGTRIVQGRAEVVQFATVARETLKQARFQLLDITVKIDPEGTAATAYMTLLADVSGEKNAISQELKVTLKKIEGKWLVARVETLRTLQ